MTERDGLVIRPYAPDDAPLVLELLSVSLGWVPDDLHARFFAWKHKDSPFGASHAWVAQRDGRILGFRAFLRWEFEQAGAVIHAARAVDTATAPHARGAGIFSRLTLHGLEGLAEAGIRFVFNTPNNQSLPGYLKMGWQDVGRLPLRVRLRSVGVIPRVVTARTAADLWSLPSEAGRPAAEALANGAALAELLRSQPPRSALRTRLSADVLRWRYAGFAPLGYRAWTGADGAAGGLALFRLRRRGAAVEAMIGDVLAPGGDPGVAAALARDVLRVSGADYAVAAAAAGTRWGGFVRLSKQGPVLTWRSVPGAAKCSSPLSWDLSLGDIELF